MKLKPLYRIRFDYPEGWSVELRGERGTEEQHFYLAEGVVEGELAGRFSGANFPRRRTDRTAVTDFRGVIETKEGAVVLWECHGYGRAHTPGYDAQSPAGRQWVASVLHFSADARYRALNDAVCVGTGQVRPKATPDPTNPSDLVLDVAELLWEPIPH